MDILAHAIAQVLLLIPMTPAPQAPAPPEPVTLEPAAPAPLPAPEWTPDPLFAALAECESGMTQMHGPRYFGFFSMLPSTARRAGLPGLPSDHDYRAQEAAAKEVVRMSGWGQFPACARELGMR